MTLDKQREMIRTRFDWHAARYGHNLLTHWIGRSELAALHDLTPPAPLPGVTPALDFGCGTGRVIGMLLERGYRVTGYDISPGMLARARVAVGARPEVTLTADRQMVQRAWPLIVSLGVLDYYPDTAPLWQEWRRLLAPEGVLVVTAPNVTSPLAWLYALASHLTCPAHLTTVHKLTVAARQAGLIVTEVRHTFPSHQTLGHTLVLRLKPEGNV